MKRAYNYVNPEDVTACKELIRTLIKIGDVYYSKQNGSEWLIWHEIQKIENNIVTLWNYGHDTECFSSAFYVKEIKSLIRKGMLMKA